MTFMILIIATACLLNTVKGTEECSSCCLPDARKYSDCFRDSLLSCLEKPTMESVTVKSPTENVTTESVTVKSPTGNVTTESVTVKSPTGNVTTESVTVKSPTTETTPKAGNGEITTTQSTTFPACAGLFKEGQTTDGVYTFTIQDSQGNDQQCTVFCDMTTAGGGWTVFQNRFDGSVDFTIQKWDEYRNGFGSVNGEFWWGLEKLSQLTATGDWILRIDLEAFSGDTAYAEYTGFSVAGESDNYRLKLGTYSGDAGDTADKEANKPEFSINNQEFTTSDRDNDNKGSWNCATYWGGGGWWHNACFNSFLNGKYRNSAVDNFNGIIWMGFQGRKSLKKSSMKFRSAGF